MSQLFSSLFSQITKVIAALIVLDSLALFSGSEDFFGVADRLSDLDLNTCEWDFWNGVGTNELWDANQHVLYYLSCDACAWLTDLKLTVNIYF